jgi:hypothetical protein
MVHGPTKPSQNSPNDHFTKTKISRCHLQISIAHNTKNSRPCPAQRSKTSSGNFCSIPNRKLLHEAGISTLAEIREQSNKNYPQMKVWVTYFINKKRSSVLNKKQSSKRYTLPNGQVNGDWS